MRILCIVIFLSIFSCNEACPSINIDVEPGLGGFYRSKQWLPLKIVLHNDGHSIQGTLSTVFSGMKYEKQIDLPAKSQKKTFLYLYPNKQENEIKISLHSNKSVILDDISKIEELDQSIIFVGILRGSNPSQSYPFLNDSGFPIRVIDFSPVDLPEEWQGYDTLDIMIIDNLNPELLSPTQKTAFKHWLLSGGKLLLYGHYPHPLDADFYEDLLPVHIFKAIAPDNRYDNSNKSDQYINSSGLLLNKHTIKNNCKIITQVDDTPVIVKSDYGMGEVIYSTIPFYLPTLSELLKNDNFHKELLSKNRRPFQKNKSVISQTLSENIFATDGKILLSWEYIFYFSTIYCGSLVALYFTVFRRKNSFAFNLTILIFFPIFFSALFGTMLFLFRSHNVKIDSFSLLIGSAQFKERILSNTYCVLSVQNQKNLELGLRSPSFIVESLNIDAKNPYTLYQAGYPALRNIRLNPLGNSTFYFRGLMDSDAFIDSDITWHKNSITGTISNTSQCNFRNSVIVSGDSYYKLPDLAAQETIDVRSKQHKGIINENLLSNNEKQFYDLIKDTLFQSVIKNRYPVLLGWFSEPILSYSINEKYYLNTHTSLFVYFL